MTMMLIAFLYANDTSIRASIYLADEKVVFYDYNETLVGVRLDVKSSIEDIFDYLTVSKNASPPGFKSYLDDEITLLEHKAIDHALILNISADIPSNDGAKIIPSLYESYRLLGFDTLVINGPTQNIRYQAKDVFSLGYYKNYDDDSTEGTITYLYTMEDNLIFFDTSYEEDSLSYLCASLNLNYLYKNHKLSIYLDETSTDLLEIICLNFKDYYFEIIS